MHWPFEVIRDDFIHWTRILQRFSTPKNDSRLHFADSFTKIISGSYFKLNEATCFNIRWTATPFSVG
jgi:hypothetical protein